MQNTKTNLKQIDTEEKKYYTRQGLKSHSKTVDADSESILLTQGLKSHSKTVDADPESILLTIGKRQRQDQKISSPNTFTDLNQKNQKFVSNTISSPNTISSIDFKPKKIKFSPATSKLQKRSRSVSASSTFRSVDKIGPNTKTKISHENFNLEFGARLRSKSNEYLEIISTKEKPRLTNGRFKSTKNGSNANSPIKTFGRFSKDLQTIPVRRGRPPKDITGSLVDIDHSPKDKKGFLVDIDHSPKDKKGSLVDIDRSQNDKKGSPVKLGPTQMSSPEKVIQTLKVHQISPVRRGRPPKDTTGSPVKLGRPSPEKVVQTPKVHQISPVRRGRPPKNNQISPVKLGRPAKNRNTISPIKLTRPARSAVLDYQTASRRGRPPKKAASIPRYFQIRQSINSKNDIQIKQIFHQPKVSAVSTNDSELESKTIRFFGDKLSAIEADTTKCTPNKSDRDFFVESTLKSQKVIQRLLQSKEKLVQMPKIQSIQIGKYLIDTWYSAPYPEEYNMLKTLFLCPYCLKYMRSEFTLARHTSKCPLVHPPGDEIYRDQEISVFEVDGRKNKIYCQNLCLLAKTFLDHKTLYYDVEPFLFYVMTLKEESGYEFIGYFSKEKRSISNNNVSCILTLPVYQRKGYGSFLIDFSKTKLIGYLLSKSEKTCGSPERPLSDLGLLAYKNYWQRTMIRELYSTQGPVSLHDLSIKTSMTLDDVARTLHELDAIYKNEKGEYCVRLHPDKYQEYIEKIDQKGFKVPIAENLKWSPFLFKRILQPSSE